MALEERQQQIKEGAGLEESRLNQDIIELLKKVSTPLLVIVAVVVGGYALYQRYERSVAEGMDKAAVELDAALDAQNPTNLVAVANDNKSRGGLPLLARLGAADLHLDAFRSGIPVGTKMGPMGDLPAETKFLTDEQRQAELAKAEEQYKAVLDNASSATGQRLAAVNALFGLSAVAESKGNVEGARGYYTQALGIAKALGLKELEAAAQKRLDTLDSVKNPPRLLANSQLHASIKPPEAPMTIPMTGLQAKDAQGNPIQIPGAIPLQITPDGKATPAGAPPAPATPGTAPTPAPAAAPAPAPAPAPKP